VRERPNKLFYAEDNVLLERLREFLSTGVWPTTERTA
jgi:hypothetical protein